MPPGVKVEGLNDNLDKNKKKKGGRGGWVMQVFKVRSPGAISHNLTMG